MHLLRSPEEMAERDPAHPSDHSRGPAVSMRTSLEMDTMEVMEMEIAHLELRYAHTRIIKRESLVALAASIEQWGQIIPVITVAPRVLIDGYRRVAALKLCKRETVWRSTGAARKIRPSCGCSCPARSEGGMSWNRRRLFGSSWIATRCPEPGLPAGSAGIRAGWQGALAFLKPSRKRSSRR